MSQLLRGCLLVIVAQAALAQNLRRVGKFQEVFAWKQMTYSINGNLLLRDRSSGDDLADTSRVKRQSDQLIFSNDNDREANWDQLSTIQSSRPSSQNSWNAIPSSSRPRPNPSRRTTTTARPSTDNTEDLSELREIQKHLEDLKKVESIAEKVSFHDVHLYAAIYFLFAAAAVAAAVLTWRRCKRNAAAA